MERISIFNYEAFYLDYLEGNLSETDTQMLLQFLEEHPECRLEDDELVTLNDEAPMTYSGKNSLKQTDETAAIGLENVEHFMIADAEGLLSDEKKAELNTVVAENQELEVTRNRYKAVYFAPDESVIFAGKADLKQRKALVLWPYLSGMVAAAAVALFMLLPYMNELSVGPVTYPEVNVAGILPQKIQTEDPVKELDPVVQKVNKENTSFVKYAVDVVTHIESTPVVKDRDAMKQIKLKPIETYAFDNTLKPINKHDGADPVPAPLPRPYRGIDEMENPIEPVTAFIAEKAKTDIDFKRRKASKDKKGGFLVKIGNFEFSKNKN